MTNAMYSTLFMAFVGAIVGGIITLLFYNKAKKKRNGFFYILLGCYSGALISATLLPLGNYGMMTIEYIPNLINLVPLSSNADIMSNAEVIQCALNVIMFMPLGILIPLAFGKKLRIREFIALCFLLSLTIEATQLVCTILGVMWRSFDINDIIFNTLGGGLTYGFVCLIAKCIYIQKRQVNNLPQNSSSI